MTISATEDNGKYIHNLLLDFSDNKSYYQMAEAFNMYDNELKLTMLQEIQFMILIILNYNLIIQIQ